jgi:ATP-dependent Lhr-like helicase
VQEALFGRRAPESEEEALRAIVGGWLEHVGPVTVVELAARAGLPASRVAIGLGQLERSGAALRGRYRVGAREEEWCDRALLARIHRLTLGRLRKEIEPVSAADLMRFFFRWQHVQAGTRLHGRHGLLAVLGQLAGLELPARAWESQILPARVSGYQPDDLEHLCLSGIVAWGRLRAAPPPDDARLRTPGRAAPLAFVLREDLPWLLEAAGDPTGLPREAELVRGVLASHGASFAADIARVTRLAPAAVEAALWTLVAHGLVTGDGVAGLRLLIDPPDPTRGARLHMLGGRRRLVPAGRWALLRGLVADEPAADADRFARLWLARWGVVLRELLARETCLPPWRVLLPALRRMEARGEVRGGRFVAGMVGEQFALPEAVEALRAVRRRRSGPETVVVGAADPLNLVGIVLPGARVPPAAHEVIAYRDGEAIEVGDESAVRQRLDRGVA